MPELTTMPRMVTIPAGRFIMGTQGEDRFANSTERPAHEVIIERSFEVASFPVTEAQWAAFRGGSVASGLPVVQVSWYAAQAYTAWLSERTGKAYRLLSEAEWEYACRAGSADVFAMGDDISPEQANYLYDEHGFKVGRCQRTPEHTFAPNAFGLQDMHGNVCEWVADAWRGTYASPPNEAARVIRGGAWDYMPRLLRCSWRDSAPPETRRDNLGFRIACDL